MKICTVRFCVALLAAFTIALPAAAQWQESVLYSF
jgi:hypothetical protein